MLIVPGNDEEWSAIRAGFDIKRSLRCTWKTADNDVASFGPTNHACSTASSEDPINPWPGGVDSHRASNFKGLSSETVLSLHPNNMVILNNKVRDLDVSSYLRAILIGGQNIFEN